MNTQQLDKLFIQYGYEVSVRKDTHRVYLSHQGMYHGAEIVVLDDAFDSKQLTADYSALGYAVITHNFADVNEAEKYLFEGFFNTKQTASRIRSRYREFSENQVRHYGDPTIRYEYIQVPYTIFSDSEQGKHTDIIEDIHSILKKKGPYLMVVEAAAGFGKTCTAFELYNSLERFTNTVQPLFTELSRNRDAKRFKYVLWSEIDAEYSSSVKQDLVVYNIRKGRIPLIIDGFDELLTKDIDDGGSTTQFDEVETMLSTIGDLLKENAKVILTSRKTAIFSGEQFSEWVDGYENCFNVVRYQLDKPEVKHWLSQDRLDKLKTNNIPLGHISNPVLLTYLRNINDIEFNALIEDAEDIVEKYFEYLLERERIRQNLVIPVKAQMVIYQELAKSFATFDISCEERNFVKELIIDYNRQTLLYYKDLSNPKPTIEELADTLTNHALLDRIGMKDYIGFINDFIFGVLLGKAIIKDGVGFFRDSTLPSDLLEKTFDAFKFAGEHQRKQLWLQLEPIRCDLPRDLQLMSDVNLLNRVKITYEYDSISTKEFEGVEFNRGECYFVDIVFTDVRFVDCIFDKEAFINDRFLGCVFSNCTIKQDSRSQISSCMCFGCEDFGNGFISAFSASFANDEYIVQKVDYESMILSQYFKVDGKSTKKIFVSNLRKLVEEGKEPELFHVFYKLKKAGYLQVDGNNSYITQDGISLYHKKQ